VEAAFLGLLDRFLGRSRPLFVGISDDFDHLSVSMDKAQNLNSRVARLDSGQYLRLLLSDLLSGPLPGVTARPRLGYWCVHGDDPLPGRGAAPGHRTPTRLRRRTGPRCARRPDPGTQAAGRQAAPAGRAPDAQTALAHRLGRREQRSTRPPTYEGGNP
jgi:hypothetical protein